MRNSNIYDSNKIEVLNIKERATIIMEEWFAWGKEKKIEYFYLPRLI